MEEVTCASGALDAMWIHSPRKRAITPGCYGNKDDEILLGENEEGEQQTAPDGTGVGYPSVAYSDIFQFASRCDLVLFTIGILAAVMQGKIC